MKKEYSLSVTKLHAYIVQLVMHCRTVSSVMLQPIEITAHVVHEGELMTLRDQQTPIDTLQLVQTTLERSRVLRLLHLKSLVVFSDVNGRQLHVL